MNNKIFAAFEPIHATEEMKRGVSAIVCGEIAKRRRKSRTPLRCVAACCAMLVLTVCGIGGYRFYATPVSYISVDVNPSVELGLNRLDCVVTVKAYNDDGALALQNLSLKYKPYTEAVELLLADEIFERYLAENALLSFTVVSEREEYLLAGIRQCQGYAQSGAECRGANAQLMDEASRSGLSFGKYQVFLELLQYNPSITPDDCKGLSMRQIRDLISLYANGGEEDLSGGRGQCRGNGYGYRGGNGWGRGNQEGH